jgi:hypothetical protein
MIARSQARKDRVPDVMLQLEAELQLLLTSTFDRLTQSECKDVAAAFDMYETIEHECAHDLHPSGAFRCTLHRTLTEVNRELRDCTINWQ